MRKKAETEHQFGSFLAQYSGTNNDPSLAFPLTGSQAGPFASVHDGYNMQSANTPSLYLPKPLPYISPTQARFGHLKQNLPRISPLNHPLYSGMASSFPVGPEALRYPAGSLFQDYGRFSNASSNTAGTTDMSWTQTQSNQETLMLDTSGASAQVIKPKKKVTDFSA